MFKLTLFGGSLTMCDLLLAKILLSNVQNTQLDIRMILKYVK